MRDEAAPGRPREFDETKMLRRMMKLFWRKGYEGVSLTDIMTATDLKKGSLYAAYGDKRAMYLKALAQYEADVVDSTAGFLKARSAPPLERLNAFLSAPLEASTKNDRLGCFLCNASADQADLNEDTRMQVSKGFETLTHGLDSLLKELHPGISSDESLAKARTLLSVYTGLRVMTRSGTEIKKLKPTVNIALSLATDG